MVKSKKLIEEWRNVVGYEGLYAVSSWGRIQNLKTKIIFPIDYSKNYYKTVLLMKDFEVKSYPIHRVVALAFLPNPDNLPIVNHIDGIKCHNNVENLEWVSYKENIEHAVLLGLKPSKEKKNERNKDSSISNETI